MAQLQAILDHAILNWDSNYVQALTNRICPLQLNQLSE